MRNLILILLAGVLVSCQNSETETVSWTVEKPAPVEINIDDIKVDGELGPFEIGMSSEIISDGVNVVSITLCSPETANPPEFTLKWSFPSSDIYAFWNSNISTDRVNYYYNRVSSRASSQAPVICFMNNRDQNRITIAVSDALNRVVNSAYLREEDIRFFCSVTFFSEPHPDISEYKVQLRFDFRNIPFYEAINDVSEWWASQDQYEPAPVPDYARMPVYSTWYSFHQNLDADELIEQCRMGKKIGLEVLIVDDGWQTMDNQRGYAFTGDWEPVRLPGMKAFVDSIHALDMKCLLWYSLPFIGEKSKNFEKFRGKYLRYWDGQGTWVLDPRYPEVREHIIETYEKALHEWDLDGFKLDFLGWFYATEETVLSASHGRDYASVNESVDRLMTDIMARLRKINPDIMIEFRQPYIGPLMRKYGNMFRAADCPNMEVVNRVRTTDLRLLSGNTAVHSDMFRWHAEDPVESAALQILNILFSVPQLSVKLDSIPDEHYQMAKFWINYWKKNRDILLDGKFIPVNPGGLYPVLMAKGSDKLIAAVYEDHFLTIEDPLVRNVDIVNAKGTETIILDLENPFGKVEVKIYDCMGNVVKEDLIRLKKGIHKFNVPPSGLLSMVKREK